MEVQSAFLKQIGLDSFDLGYLLVVGAALAVLVLVLIILLIVQICKANKLKKRLDSFMQGKDGISLEEDINRLFQDNNFLREESERNREDILALYKKLESTYQKMGLVKYDAFNQMGGQLSFSLALLDQNDNGFIINSVHSTEGCYLYTKEIKNGDNNLSLSTEEAEALAIAMRG